MTDKSVVPIDWSQPIEAVHTDGRVVPARVLECDRKKPFTYALVQAHEQYWGCSYKGDVAALGWRIRNVASNPLNLETSDLEPITLEEDALATAIIAAGGLTRQSLHGVVRAIRAGLAKAGAVIVRGDLTGQAHDSTDLLEARKLAEEIDPSGGLYLSGHYDDGRMMYCALNAIRRGRASASTHSIQSDGEGGEG